MSEIPPPPMTPEQKKAADVEAADRILAEVRGRQAVEARAKIEKDYADYVALYATKLREAIVKLSASVKLTSIQCKIDPFLKHISPTLSDRADTYFPTTVREHAKYPERSAHEGKINTLVFYVGDSVLCFYDLVNTRKAAFGEVTYNVEAMEAIAALLDHRLTRLRLIAELDVHNFTVEGDEAVGFFLFNRHANRTLKDRECSRVGCQNRPAPCKHTKTFDLYCVPCAHLINRENTPGLILIPKA